MFGGWYFFTRKEVDLMIVTKHAKQRMKQRCGLKEKSSDRIAKIAYEKGLRHSDLTGNLKKWVDSLYFRNRSANQIRLYSDKAYIFTGDKLITVIQIPHNLVKEVDKLRRSKQQYDAEVKFEKNEKGTL